MKPVAYTTMYVQDSSAPQSSTVKLWDPHLTSDVHTLAGTSSETNCQTCPLELNPAYPRMCDKHGSEPWVGVPPVRTLHGQAINALQDPASAPNSFSPVTAALVDHSAYNIWRPTRMYITLLLSLYNQQLEPSAYISHQQPVHLGIQEALACLPTILHRH